MFPMDELPWNGVCYSGDLKAVTSLGTMALDQLVEKPSLEFLTPWGLRHGWVRPVGVQRCKTVVLRRDTIKSQYHPFEVSYHLAPITHPVSERQDFFACLSEDKKDFDAGFIHGMAYRHGKPFAPSPYHENIRSFPHGFEVAKKHLATLLPFLNSRHRREVVLDSHSSREVFFRSSINYKGLPFFGYSESYHGGFLHGFFSFPSKTSYPKDRFRLAFYDSLDHSLSEYILGHAAFAGWLVNPSFQVERNQVFFEVLFDRSLFVHRILPEGEPRPTFAPCIPDFPFFSAHPGIRLPAHTERRCVSRNTLIHTTQGPVRAEELYRKKFKGITQGADMYPSKKEGFQATGKKPLYLLKTREGFSIEATEDQPFRTAYNPELPLFAVCNWVPLNQLQPGDQIQLSTHAPHAWGGPATFSHGWLLAALLFHGTITPEDGSSDTGTGTLHFNDYDPQFFLPLARKIITYSLPYRSTHEDSRQVGPITDGTLYTIANRFHYTQKPFYLSNEIEFTSNDFYKGFLQGLMDFASSTDNLELSVLHHALFTPENYQCFQRMFLRLGIRTTFAGNQLVMDHDNLVNFLSKTGFTHPDRIAYHKAITPSHDYQFHGIHVATVQEITCIGEDTAFSCHLPTFDGNGFLVKGLP